MCHLVVAMTTTWRCACGRERGIARERVCVSVWTECAHVHKCIHACVRTRTQQYGITQMCIYMYTQLLTHNLSLSLSLSLSHTHTHTYTQNIDMQRSIT